MSRLRDRNDSGRKADGWLWGDAAGRGRHGVRMNMPITLLDGILAGFTLVSAMLAMVRGFSREILSIVSWVAAAAAAYFLYPHVVPYLAPYVDNDKIRMAAAAGIVFLV